MKAPLSRRHFLGHAATASAGMALGLSQASSADKPAKSTGARASATTAHSGSEWPISDQRDENALLDVLHSGKWGRTGAGGVRVKEFEALFAKRMGAKYCLATSSGTTALLSSLGALNIGPGDEVILPPYTFVATFNVITANFALPVFADVDADSFQIDPAKISAKITPATKLLLPVHIGGSTCEIDAIAEIARSRKIALVEDACQALTAEWRGQPIGTKGIGGCFSFQASKNLTSGEGGAVLTNDEEFANQVYNFHTPGGSKPGQSLGRAANYRITEFQAGLLLAQYTRFEAQQTQRTENATYLSSLLQKIPGIAPAKLASGNNRSGWHLFMMRYDARQFAGLSRAKFLQAINKEGVSAGSGYSSLNNSAHVKALAANPHYQRIYGKETMAKWVERNQCPVNDRVIEEAVWLGQTKLLSPRSEMERIAEVIASVKKRAGDLARA
jgi:dTDP-4-amino-4,6-dideoxygalactose transaminase